MPYKEPVVNLDMKLKWVVLRLEEDLVRVVNMRWATKKVLLQLICVLLVEQLVDAKYHNTVKVRVVLEVDTTTLLINTHNLWVDLLPLFLVNTKVVYFHMLNKFANLAKNGKKQFKEPQKNRNMALLHLEVLQAEVLLLEVLQAEVLQAEVLPLEHLLLEDLLLEDLLLEVLQAEVLPVEVLPPEDHHQDRMIMMILMIMTIMNMNIRTVVPKVNLEEVQADQRVPVIQ